MVISAALGRLKRKNIIVLYRKRDNFEWPSDIKGVTYKEYDDHRWWSRSILPMN